MAILTYTRRYGKVEDLQWAKIVNINQIVKAKPHELKHTYLPSLFLASPYIFGFKDHFHVGNNLESKLLAKDILCGIDPCSSFISLPFHLGPKHFSRVKPSQLFF